MTKFLDLLSELQNPEKTRNFNVFKNYSLEHFETQLQRYKDLLSLSENYNPFRFSVIGTNGKGSTAFYLAEILRRSFPENAIGLYTSPHLKTPFERILVNGLAIKEQEADDLILQLKEISESHLKELSYFECLTLLCFCFFKQRNCRYEIWEAGLGGRLDATKLANANILILTKIGIDHSEILGDTLEKIVYEKLMIAGPNAKKIYSFPVTGSLKTRILEIAEKLHLEIKFYEEPPIANYLYSNFNFAKWVLADLNLLDTKREFVFDQMNRPKGRMEVISENPFLIFDPAHNPDAVRHTIEAVRQTYQWNKASLLVGCLPDKDAISIWKEIKEFPWEQILFYEEPGFYPWSQFLTSKEGQFVHSKEDLAKCLGQIRSPLLALGSFRLYPILTTLYQNDVIL